MTQGIQREFPVSPTLAGGFFTTELHNGCEKKSESEVNSLNHVRLFVTLWTVAYQAPQSMEFSSQEYRCGLPFPSPNKAKVLANSDSVACICICVCSLSV